MSYEVFNGVSNVITLYLLHPVHKTPVQNWTFEQVSKIRIGRSTSNDVVLYSAVVSRHHVEIHRTSSGWHLKNTGTNGTYLDGKRISEIPVANGLVIRLARSGPIIQIHTDHEEEATDPLQQILSVRALANSATTPQADTQVDAAGQPHDSEDPTAGGRPHSSTRSQD